jgi:hypothetical protein
MFIAQIIAMLTLEICFIGTMIWMAVAMMVFYQSLKALDTLFIIKTNPIIIFVIKQQAMFKREPYLPQFALQLILFEKIYFWIKWLVAGYDTATPHLLETSE